MDTKKPRLPIPNWIVNSLAWLAVVGFAGWVGAINMKVEKLGAEQHTLETKVASTIETTNIHLLWIKESLNRIETEVKENKHGN